MNIKSILVNALVVLSIVSCNQQGNSQSNNSNNQAEVVNIDASKFAQMSKDSNVVIIDVRTPGEVASGYIPGASKFIDVNSSEFEKQISQLDTNKTYLVYCRSGARSSNASNYMINNGFKKVYNLNGGIMGWPGDIKKD